MLPENYKPKKSQFKISLVFILSFAAYLIVTSVKEDNAFSGGSRYTIGLVTGTYNTTSGRSVRYKYKVRGVTYEGSSGYKYDCEVPARYWVEFAYDDPNYSKIYLDKQVTDSIKSIPVDGYWSMSTD